MATWMTRTDLRAPGSEVSRTDTVVIGEDIARTVLLPEVPLAESPSTVTVTGGGVATWTEVTDQPTAAGQYRVRYHGRLMGAVDFHAADAGRTVTIAYKGRGTNLFARDLNRLQTEKLDRDGQMPLTGPLQLALGTAAAPGLGFTGDPTSGFFRPAANEIAVAIGGVERLRVTATALRSAGALVIAGTEVLSAQRVLANVTADAAILTAGTLDVARLPSTLAFRNAANQFTVSQGIGAAAHSNVRLRVVGPTGLPSTVATPIAGDL